MRGSRIAVAALGAAFLALAACGNDGSSADPGDAARCLPDAVDCDDTPPVAGMCAPGVPDCVDTVVDGGNGIDVGEPNGDMFDSESERNAARAMLGLAEADLAPDVRVGRRGGEQMMLTEDYVLGRKTVELDGGADGVFRVTKVIVELPDGPETFS
jgi:hypothetical protein